MRASALWTLLVAGAAALPADQATTSLAPLPTGNHPFRIVAEEEAVSSLIAAAEKNPHVTILPGVSATRDSHGKLHYAKPTRAAEIAPKVLALANEKRSVKRSPAEEEATRIKNRQTTTTATTCTSPTTVYEWRNLSPSQQSAYVNAVACLMRQPSRSGLAGAQNRWDDFAALHQTLTPQIHMDAEFLPWHRNMLYAFEHELRSVCGYTGAMTWWDETKDAGNFHSSPLCTSSYFGSCPTGGPQCVKNGAFAFNTLHIGPGPNDSNHCLARGVNEKTSKQITASYINTCWSQTDYNQMQQCFDYGVHALGHNAIGGNVMNDVYASPQDALFFMHHHFMNRNWNYWQRLEPSYRLALDGYTTSACEQGTQTSGCTTITPSYVLTTLGFYPNVTVAQVMDIQGGYLCYQYDY